MKKEIPCINCITLGACKGRINSTEDEYIKDIQEGMAVVNNYNSSALASEGLNIKYWSIYDVVSECALINEYRNNNVSLTKEGEMILEDIYNYFMTGAKNE